MMDRSEIMMGDWVVFQGREIVAGPEIFKDEYADCGIEPIRLTAATLDASGFEKSFGWYVPEKAVWRMGDLRISEDGETWICGVILPIHITYVHELQHLMRSLGMAEEAVAVNITYPSEPSVGDIVTVKGLRVRITEVLGTDTIYRGVIGGNRDSHMTITFVGSEIGAPGKAAAEDGR